jgi:hypothetical protein
MCEDLILKFLIIYFSDFDGYSSDELKRYSQEDMCGPTTKLSKAELAEESRSAVPRAKQLLSQLQNNPHETNPLFNSLTVVHHSALIDYLVYDNRGKNVIRRLGNNANFSQGPVNLPTDFIPDTSSPIWKQAVVHEPYDIIRDRFPLKQDGTYQSHPKPPASVSTVIPDADIGMKEVATLINRAFDTHLATKVLDTVNEPLRVFFTRISNGVSTPSAVPLDKSQTIFDHALKLKTLEDSQYQSILKNAKLGKEIVFCIPQISKTLLHVPFNRAKDDDYKMASLLKDADVQRPIIIDIDERDKVLQVPASDEDLFC